MAEVFGLDAFEAAFANLRKQHNQLRYRWHRASDLTRDDAIDTLRETADALELLIVGMDAGAGLREDAG